MENGPADSRKEEEVPEQSDRVELKRELGLFSGIALIVGKYRDEEKGFA